MFDYRQPIADAHIVSLSCVKPIGHETYYSKIFRLRIMERWNKSVFILFLTFITNFNLFNVDHKDKSRHFQPEKVKIDS